MSVADQINRIKTNIANAYSAAEAKGATMPEAKNSENLSACVDSITTGGGGGTQFGLTAEQMLGTVDSEGSLTIPKLPSITFTGVKNISTYGFNYKFYRRVFETGSIVSFPNLTTVSVNGMYNCFSDCTSLASVNLPALTTVGSGGLSGCFSYCTSLASVNLPALTTVESSGSLDCFSDCTSLASVNLPALTTVGSGGLSGCFSDCTSLASVNLPALTTVGSGGLSGCFSYCTSLATISFSALTDVRANSFGTASHNYCFANCTALTEIHFRADMQATIEAMDGYADKWGATNATIYFDL